MRVSILQPSYLPWSGYFEQMDFADAFVFLNDVQYTKNDWRNRNRIKSERGPAWITVPVRRRSSKQKIREILINYDRRWFEDHVNLLTFNYRKAPYFEAVMAIVVPHLNARYDRLEDLSTGLTLDLAAYLGIRRRILKSSEIEVRSADPNLRLIQICRAVGATEFYEGASGRDYLDTGLFEKNGITVSFQDYRHPVYRQFHEPFVSHLSVVDLLFHYGPEAGDIIASGH